MNELADGILLTADNPSASLHKVSEIYDSIAFAGAGKYSVKWIRASEKATHIVSSTVTAK